MRNFLSTYIYPFVVIACAAAIAALMAMPFKSLVGKQDNYVDKESLTTVIGNGMFFGMLGGYRSLTADFVWVKSYLAWEKQDIASCMSMMKLAVAIDPLMKTYWTQGASVIAHDFPRWQWEKMPKNLQTEQMLQRLRERNVQNAYNFLDSGLKIMPNDVSLLMKKGQIALIIGDSKMARQCYAKLSSLPNPSVLARRTYVDILVSDGDFKEAIVVLEKVLPEIHVDSPAYKDICAEIDSLKKRAKTSQR